jgi:ubiquinone/menaquinone biosynthesis C-methylase UbiE
MNPKPFSTAGEVVQWFRASPDMQELVRFCYWDEDSTAALSRFSQSEEFQQIVRLLQGKRIDAGARVLDLGAGNGIVAHAFRQAGYDVIALEPDSSTIVGYGAMVTLSAAIGVPIPIVAAVAEQLPFLSGTFDVVYCRQVLHHIADLPAAMREVHRVMRKGGVFLATREHVVDDAQQLQAFLSQHPMHRHVGGENAYPLDAYVAAFRDGGFKRTQVIGPLQNVINFFPLSVEEWRSCCAHALARRLGSRVGPALARLKFVQVAYGRLASMRDRTPGRLYSFVSRA